MFRVLVSNSIDCGNVSFLIGGTPTHFRPDIFSGGYGGMLSFFREGGRGVLVDSSLYTKVVRRGGGMRSFDLPKPKNAFSVQGLGREHSIHHNTGHMISRDAQKEMRISHSALSPLFLYQCVRSHANIVLSPILCKLCFSSYFVLFLSSKIFFYLFRARPAPPDVARRPEWRPL